MFFLGNGFGAKGNSWLWLSLIVLSVRVVSDLIVWVSSDGIALFIKICDILFVVEGLDEKTCINKEKNP